MFLCDVVQQISQSCTSTPEESGLFFFRENGAESRRVPRSDGINGDTVANASGLFLKPIERFIDLQVSKTFVRDVIFKTGTRSLDGVVGVHLGLSSRRDYRVCIDVVAKGSIAEKAGLVPGAVIVSVNGRSMLGFALNQVEEAIQRVLDAAARNATVRSVIPGVPDDCFVIRCSQRVEETANDAHLFRVARIPSPKVQRRASTTHFQPFVRLQVPDEEEDDHQSNVDPRDRSRSMKHFWMSDRSAKACYECEQLFSFFRRKHHCRSCGQIFCYQCCARLPQSFGGTKVDESISRLRKQLVCHTCHRQLREGLEVELAGSNGRNTMDGTMRPENSPVSQTLMLMPPQIAEALERSTSDTSQFRHLDRRELFDKDEISNDDVTARTSEIAEKARSSVLFSMFPKVQIVASVQQLTHQPRLQGVSTKHLQKSRVGGRRRAYSLPFAPIGGHDRKNADDTDDFTSTKNLKRSKSLSEIGGSLSLQYKDGEMKQVSTSSTVGSLVSSVKSAPPRFIRSRPKAMSGTFDEARFGTTVKREPFGRKRVQISWTKLGVQPADIDRAPGRDSGILALVGLSEDARDDSDDPLALERREDALRLMISHANDRLEERIFHIFESSPVLSRLAILDQHKWMQIIKMFAVRAATTVSCKPKEGDSMDIMEYVQVKCLDGGRVQDSFFIDGVLMHKSLARKGMRSDIENPRILLIASDLDYQRKKEAIASLESVAQQEVEYMHIVAEKILTMHPDIVMFSGHVHRVAEELLFKEGVSVIKNVRMVDMQRIARTTGASLLTSYDHVDKISDKSVIGTCNRFYVMISDYEPRSGKRFELVKSPHHGGHSAMQPERTVMDKRKKRPQRQNIVFEGGIASRGCTICLRGGLSIVFDEVTKALSVITRVAYNLRLQRRLLLEYGYLPPKDEGMARSVAEEWFVKTSTSLYITLKSNSLSMRAALKETQSLCKWCKDHTRFNNISSLRVLNADDDYRRNAPDAVDWNSGSTAKTCTCTSKSSELLRDRILFSACWSSLEGRTASKAEMMCIDFYTSNDCSVGQFFDKYCFSSSNRDFKRAFQTSKLSFSHDVGRVTFRVKDLSEFKDPSDRQIAAADMLRDLSYRAVLRMIKSDCVYMWSRSVDADRSSLLASRYAPVPDDVWNYSFGKFLEDMLYGKSLQVDSVRFPHLRRVRNTRDPSLVHYFSRRGIVVSVQCEPLEPVLHVALQPVLWQDHVDHDEQLAAIHQLCEAAREVYDTTTNKIAKSVADVYTSLHAKAKLRILRNEVQQWYSCYASKVEANPPEDVFDKNARFKDIYKHAVDWSTRITQAMQSTFRPPAKNVDNSPKSSLPRAWLEQITGAMEREGGGSLFEPPPIQFQETVVDMAGDLANLARFARSLATGEVVGPTGFSNLSNEVTNTLNAKSSNNLTDMFDALAEEREDQFSHSFPNESSDNSMYATNNVGASTVGSQSASVALESFRRAQQIKKKDPWGYLTIPKCLLDWHPSLPSGVKDTVVLVSVSEPTSVVAYSLCSKTYTQRVNGYIRKESITLDGPVNSMESEACSTENAMLKMLRSTRRNNVEHSFTDESQFHQGSRFACKSYYAMQFHALRRLYYGGDRNYVESLCHCDKWNVAGGKSGAGFLKTRDQRFIAKAIPEIELQMFLSMANEYFGYMAKTFESNLSSMLSKVLGVYKICISGENDQKMCIVVMENLMYGRDVNLTFDLKGKMEGRYKEHDFTRSTVLWDRNFVEMAGGIPLPLQESAMSLLLSAIANDTTFLASVQATDYSMLVGYDVRKQEVVACIIDYIHKYDFLKMVEHAGKRLIQDEGEITVLNPRQYRKRFCSAMTKYFVSIPSRYTKVTTMTRGLKEVPEEEVSSDGFHTPALPGIPRPFVKDVGLSAASSASSATSNASTQSARSSVRA
ncbi:hypothetical protein Poli38472_003636 [Pythium oligandrum]|uniref:1-phosphatidylinositol-3-phosphate 5-kinase n=1 Tax=Pythium oligandrum TaxID=41045 RepID=A0A8K1CLK0_PYTOL|nr:hypothetical protein Poli38472_003636 [Pythium oligandrum]|eukprot:TMW65871.1 hypothetical protein Poli38472_003636 [Pythium oligandrum]